ncbi:MAG TPA: bifunctional nuclease family protein [Candidatus Limnocylindrales bacterium]|nr:bifunctional nuclease family protein [Candidatus Limnocylindrales bacterium]
MDGLVEMVVESVRVHMLSNRHVVILKDVEQDRYLPIWIGAWEASAIAMRLQGLTAERPLTHDLFAATLEQLDVRVNRVVISELADETYHARLYLQQDGREVEVDARPSDALALAVRTDVPIYAAEAVLAQAALGGDPDQEDEGETAGGEAERAGSGGGPRERGGRRRIPLERVGEGIVDPRLNLFRDFVNSLDVDPGAGEGPQGQGGSGGSRPGGGKPGGGKPGGGKPGGSRPN